jgi:hypothetical protein
MQPTRLRSVVRLAAACLLAGLAAGCGDGVGKRVPVEGRVLVEGEPLTRAGGTVAFVPDPGKGNRGTFWAVGPIDADGRFTLATRGKAGVPAGWYKVVVKATPPGADDRETQPDPLHHPRFAAANTTPLSVEVVTAPSAGAYDLVVTHN